MIMLFMIKRDLFVAPIKIKYSCRVSFSGFTDYTTSGVTRTRIRVIGVNFSEILIKGKEIQVELGRNSSNPSLSKPSEND